MKPSFDEVKSVLDNIAKNHSYRKRLFDFSEVDIDFTTHELRSIAAYGKFKFTRKSKLAVYTVDDLSFGEMRQFEVYREEEGKAISGVFRTEQAAIEWLNK